MPLVSVNTGVSSTGDHTISSFASRLNGQTDEEASNVAIFSPEATLRATGRWPRMKFGLVTMYSSIQPNFIRSEEHTSELQSHSDLVCRLLLEKKKK